jgi:hypothetical protein
VGVDSLQPRSLADLKQQLRYFRSLRWDRKADQHFPRPDGSTFDNLVIVPPGFAATGTQSTPTSVVFNGSPTDFILDKGTPAGKRAVFIFATDDGTISGWNPAVNILAGSQAPSSNAVL